MASFSVGVRNFDGRHFQHVRAEFREALRKTAGLFRAPRDDDALAEERPILKPVQFAAQLHHVADDGEGRGRDFFFRGECGDGGERAGHGLLPAGRAAMNDGYGRFWRHAVRDERFCPVR